MEESQRASKIEDIQDRVDRDNALKAHRVLQFMRQEDFSPFDLVRTIFHVDAFSEHATDLKNALLNEENTQTLRAILDQHHTSQLLDSVTLSSRSNWNPLQF